MIIKGKTFIVTGGASGLGLATAKMLVEAKYEIKTQKDNLSRFNEVRYFNWGY